MVAPASIRDDMGTFDYPFGRHDDQRRLGRGQHRNPENIDYQKQVIDFLLATGWQAYGTTVSRKPGDPEDAFLAATPGRTEAGFRPRYRSGAWRVTVGPRTTYFYHPRGDQAYWEWDGVRIRTRDIEEIRRKAQEVAYQPPVMEERPAHA